MRLGRNLLAGLANSIWTAILTLAVVPLYLSHLGIEAYGLIGFFATTQALFQILDLGLAPTINREVARNAAVGNVRAVGALLHTLEIIYWGVACMIAIVIAALASPIADHWLQSKALPRDTVVQAVMLMGVIVSCRWPIGLYKGALMGAERLTVVSYINIGMLTLGNLGAVVVLAVLSPTIQAFFIWQAAVGLVYALTIRRAAWRAVGRPSILRFNVGELKRIWRFSAGMSGVAVSAVILMQLDKIILSGILNLEEFGSYSLAALLASSLYVLLTPVFNVISPRMASLVATGETEKLIDLYRLGTRLFLAVLFPLAITAAVCSIDLVYLWTDDLKLAVSIAPAISFFLVGTALNGVMHFPYALQLAYGKTHLPLMINAILMIALIPMIIFLALRYGTVGGAAAWALLNSLYLLVGTWLTHRSLLKGIGFKWLFGDVAIPLFFSLLLVGVIGGVVNESDYPRYIKMLFVIVLAVLAFLMTILVSPRLSNFVRNGILRIAK